MTKKLLGLGFFIAVLYFFLNIGSAQAAYQEFNFGRLDCIRHGGLADKACEWMQYFDSNTYETYQIDSFKISGHRHGSSWIGSYLCLVPMYAFDGWNSPDSDFSQCRAINAGGNNLGFEYGGVHPYNPLRGTGSCSGPSPTCDAYQQQSGISVNNDINNDGGYFIYMHSYVQDAEVGIEGHAYAFKSDPTPPPPPPSIVGLNFHVHANCSGENIANATVNIDQDFGNGTSRNTDGNGNANFGVSEDTNIGWSVPNFGSYIGTSGVVYSGSGTTVDVTMTRACGGSEPPPPPPPPAPTPTPVPPPAGASCIDNSSVSFLTAIPASVTPGQVVPFTIRVTDTGNTRWYHGNAYRFIQQSGLSIVSTAPANVAGLNYGHLPYGAWPGDSIDWTFNLTAPSTPGSYALNMRMLHYAGWDYGMASGPDCVGPSSNTYFGSTATGNFTVAVGNNSACTSLTAPATATAGSAVSGNVVFTNNGSSTWKNQAQDPTNYYGVTNLPWPAVSPGFSGFYATIPTATVAPAGTSNFPFTVTAPTTPGVYALSFRMLQQNVAWFGATCTQNVTVTAIPSSTIGFTVTYTAAALNAPTGVNITNTPCSKLNVNWTYTSNGSEDGFNIYRSTDGSTWALAQFISNTALRTWQDTPPVTDQLYYYMIRTHRSAITPNESSNSNVVSGFNQSCLANLTFSNEVLSKINGNAYNTSTVIKSGDVLTYQITIINSGPANAAINYICENHSTNLSMMTNVAASGSGSALGAPSATALDSTCATAGHSGRRINITGTKNIANNWIITFDTVYTSNPALTNQGKIDNNNVIYYTDGGGLHTKTVTAPSILTTGSGSGIPIFREVTP